MITLTVAKDIVHFFPMLVGSLPFEFSESSVFLVVGLIAWDSGARVLILWESSVRFRADEDSSVMLQLPLHPAFLSAAQRLCTSCSHI